MVKQYFKLQNCNFAIVAVFTAINTYVSQSNKNKIDQESSRIQNASLELQDYIKRTDFENNLKFKLYEEVKDAISKKDSDVQNAVLLIIMR